MAINTVSVVGPRSEPREQKEQKKDPLDQILQGLQIANGVLGIGVNYQQINKYMEDRAKTADVRKGIATKAELAEMMEKGAQQVAPGTPNSVAMQLREGEGDDATKPIAITFPGAGGKGLTIPKFEKVPTKGGTIFVKPEEGKFVPGPDPKPTKGSGGGGISTPKPSKTAMTFVGKDENGNDIYEAVEVKPGAQITKQGKAEKSDKNAPKSYEDRLKAMSTSDKQRFDGAAMGLEASVDMAQAFAKGDNTRTLVGDNDFTMALNRYKESIGRMQSGGAIQADEAKAFLEMAPTPMDSREIQEKKLTWIATEMANRVKTLGFEPEEVLGARKKLGEQVTTQGQQKGKGPAVPFAPGREPGAIVEVKGKRYQIGPDGDQLIPLGGQ